MRLKFVVPGPPVPKARARVVASKSGRARSFTPQKTAEYENAVRGHALRARLMLSHRWGWDNVKARFGLSVHVFRSAARGDCDNYLKSIADACNGILWPDDRQIREMSAKIEECPKGQERAEVEVWVL